jgi:hypothetical protein
METQKGPFVGIFHQYAHYAKGPTVILSTKSNILVSMLMIHPKAFRESNIFRHQKVTLFQFLLEMVYLILTCPLQLMSS